MNLHISHQHPQSWLLWVDGGEDHLHPLPMDESTRYRCCSLTYLSCAVCVSNLAMDVFFCK